MKTMDNDSELLVEYDFTNAEKGKYAKKYAKGTNMVAIEEDILTYFPDEKSINQALRSFIPIIKQHDLAVSNCS